MKNKILIFAVLMMSGFTMFGQGLVENGKYPFSFYVYPCDEPVVINGEFHVVFDEQVSASGRFHGRFHINAKGKGAGDETGAKYEWNEVINDTYNISPGGTETYHDRLRILGQGKASDFFLDITFHITINSNGVVSVFFDTFEAVCK